LGAAVVERRERPAEVLEFLLLFRPVLVEPRARSSRRVIAARPFVAVVAAIPTVLLSIRAS
jgi:hypothetical protein